MKNDFLERIEKYPLATREQILVATLHCLRNIALQNGAVGLGEIDYYLRQSEEDFKHVLVTEEREQQFAANIDSSIPLNCPFCGGKAAPVECHKYHWYIQCQNKMCCAVLQPSECRRHAVEKWNTRKLL